MFNVLFGISLLGSIFFVGRAAYYSLKKKREYQQQIQQIQQQIEERVKEIKVKQQLIEKRDLEIETLANEYNQAIRAKRDHLSNLESEYIGITLGASQIYDSLDSLNQEREEFIKKSNEELAYLLAQAIVLSEVRDRKKQEIQELTNSTYYC